MQNSLLKPPPRERVVDNLVTVHIHRQRSAPYQLAAELARQALAAQRTGVVLANPHSGASPVEEVLACLERDPVFEVVSEVRVGRSE